MFYVLSIVFFLLFLIILFLPENEKVSRLDKYDTNIFSNAYKNKDLNFKDFLDNISSKIPDKDSKDLCEMLDYLFNSFSLKHLEVISEIDPESVIFSSLVRLKKQQNDFFKDFPSQRPNHYTM